MKVLFTSTGDDLNAVLDPRFGRAAKFLICNLDDDSVEVFDNSVNIGAAHGAGIAAAEAVCNLGVGAVITGNCGPKAYAALSAAGIKVYTVNPASIVSLLEAYKNDELELANTANVTGHWSGGVRVMNNNINNVNEIPVNSGNPVCTGERLGRGWGGAGQGLGRGAKFAVGAGVGRGAGCGRGRSAGRVGQGRGMGPCGAGFSRGVAGGRGAGRGMGTGRGF